MAAVTTGLTGFVFGAGSLTSPAFSTNCLIVGDLPLNVSNANQTSIKDMDGNEVTRRRDDIKKELTVTLKVKAAFTELTLGATVTIADTVIEIYNGTYEVDKISPGLKSGDFMEYQVSLIRTEYIVNA